MRSLRRLLQRLQASLHAWCGWLLFRAGCRLRARRHYERVLQLRGDDFGAYVHLGRIAFAIGDYSGWRREFEHARRTDPSRFARLRHPFELFEPRLAGTSVDDSGFADGSFTGTEDRATWRSLLFGQARHNSGLRGEAADAKGPEAGALDGGLDALLAGAVTDRPAGTPPSPGAADDCSTSAERRRFAELGPIGSREVRQCDLDELARRLSG